MGLNSKAFTVDGKTYTAGIENGQVQEIILIDGGVSVNPSSDLFNQLAENEAVLDAISVDTTGATGNVDTTVLEDKEKLDANYDKNVKSENNKNKDINETGEQVPSVTAENASVKTNRASTLRYPYDIDINQDHLKIMQYEYARSEINSSKPTSSVISDKDKPFGKYTGGVILPMPKVSDSNGAEWGKSDLNVFGIGALGIAGSIIKDFEENYIKIDGKK